MKERLTLYVYKQALSQVLESLTIGQLSKQEQARQKHFIGAAAIGKIKFNTSSILREVVTISVACKYKK